MKESKIKNAMKFLVLGTATLSGLVGMVGIAVAGIAIYLTMLEAERDIYGK